MFQAHLMIVFEMFLSFDIFSL